MVLSEAAYERILVFTAVVGVPIERAVSNAVTEWMNGTGYLVMDAIEKRAKANAAKPKLILVKGQGSHEAVPDTVHDQGQGVSSALCIFGFAQLECDDIQINPGRLHVHSYQKFAKIIPSNFQGVRGPPRIPLFHSCFGHDRFTENKIRSPRKPRRRHLRFHLLRVLSHRRYLTVGSRPLWT